MTGNWPAPYVATPVDAEITIPGSKSLTNRALVLAALADSPSTLLKPLEARDTVLMAQALESLGARVDRAPDTWRITPVHEFRDAHVDCGLAGTVMRFVPLVAALSSSNTHFDGDRRAYERPMGATIRTLRALGATVEDEARETLPFTVTGGPAVRGGRLDVDASASSQFVSALLLIAARLEQGLDLHHVGAALPSIPHIEMTVSELRRRGVSVESSTKRWRVAAGPIAGIDTTIEPDLSNAGPFIAAALVTGGRVTMKNWPRETDQAGAAWEWLVPAFGGRIERSGEDMTFYGTENLQAITVDLHEVGELTPVVAAIASLAEGTSTLSGIAHLRGHETDRLAALRREINALGGSVTETEDGLIIEATPLRSGLFKTYDDHRMAHAAAVIALHTPGVVIENIGTTAKTFPAFAEAWSEMLGS